MNKSFIFALLTALLWCAAARAQESGDTNLLFAPLVFDKQQPAHEPAIDIPSLLDNNTTPEPADPQWLADATRQRRHVQATRYRAMIDHPQLVSYNTGTLPDAPKEYALKATPGQALLSVPAPVPADTAALPDAAPVKVHNWLHTFNGSLHFTQAYISGNWYQGGENTLNLLADVKWECNLNQNVHPDLLFNNTLQYKFGISTAHSDTLRNYLINEDNLLFTSQFGYKAVKHWYYSAMLQFQTQFFNSYKSNKPDMKACFLSPAELTLGLGMTYDYKDKTGDKTLTVSISPLSYNLKICRNIDDLDPTTFGIDAGHHTKHNFGSNVEAKWLWKITPNITWESRLYAFTNYKYVQGDWENTFDFSITRYLNTKIYTHLRYDKSHPYDEDWRYWQFKEILSFGLVYRFATI